LDPVNLDARPRGPGSDGDGARDGTAGEQGKQTDRNTTHRYGLQQDAYPCAPARRMQGVSRTAREAPIRLVFHLTTFAGLVTNSAGCARFAGLGGDRVASALDVRVLAIVEAIEVGDSLAGAPLTLPKKIDR